MAHNKLQYMLINHLQKHGSIKLTLPGEVELEIGINQLDHKNNLVKVDNYCWVMATYNKKTVVLDSYNLALRFPDSEDALLLNDTFVSHDGSIVRGVDLV